MFKILTSHARKQKRIPILSQIEVRDGFATSTDLDFYITMPLDHPMENGMYYAEGFAKNIRILSECPISDFPKLTEEKTILAQTSISAAMREHMEWVMKAASKEEARYYLNGAYFDWSEKDAVIVATDGHRLHTFKTTINADRPKKKRVKVDGKLQNMFIGDGGVIMHKRAIKIILDLMKAQPAADAFFTFYAKTFCAQIGCAVVIGKLIDGTFPNWRKVVPEDKGGKTTLFDPDEIKAILPQLEILKKITSQSKTIEVRIKDGKASNVTFEKRAMKEWPVSTVWDIEAGFNARYLSEICGGVMHYKDAQSPFKVVDRRNGIDKMAVIMPLRV